MPAKKQAALLIMSMLFMNFTQTIGAHAENASWGIQKTNNDTIVAYSAHDHQGPNGPLIVLLNVGFDPSDGCQSEIGVAILAGKAAYGKPVGKVTPANTVPIDLKVDGKPVATPAPLVIKYDNGWEMIFKSTPQILRVLENGTAVVVQLVPDSPKFGFPISGARDAFARGLTICRSLLPK